MLVSINKAILGTKEELISICDLVVKILRKLSLKQYANNFRRKVLNSLPYEREYWVTIK